MILSFDISSVNTGWAALEDNMDLIGFGNIKPPKPFSHAEKIQYTYDEINILVKKYQPKEVAIEDQFNRLNVSTLKLLCRLSSTAILAAQQQGSPSYLYPPKEVKKEFTGNGNAKKEDIINKVKALYAVDEKMDDNAADAIAIGWTHLSKQKRS